MTNPRYPELAAEIGHRGDTTGGPPPAGMPAAPGTWQGGSVNPTPAQLAALPDLAGDLARRGDLSGQAAAKQPRDPYSGKRGRDLKASWEWLAFAASLPADPVPFGPISAGQLLQSGRAIYIGAAFKNTGTGGGDLQVLDGMDASGNLVDRITVAANGLARATGLPYGVLCESGIYLVPTSATLQGVLWLVHLWKYPFTPPGE